MKYLCYTLGTETDAIPAPSPDMMAEMGDFVAEAMASGKLIATGGVAPIAQAFRVRYDAGEFTVTDGPFSEAKELVGGWALIDVPTRAEAEEMAKRFLRIAGGGESTIRPSFGPDDDFPMR